MWQALDDIGVAHHDPFPFSVIQGGMGAGVSGYRLARDVAALGGLGVVSGTALETIMVRRLQNGDPGGDTREALAHFPHREIAEWILTNYFLAKGRDPGTPYRSPPFPRFLPDGAGGFIMADATLTHLIVAANFVEVWLAKRGHVNPVGINYLYKIRWPTLPSLYGAMLAGVDVILMGAGFPTEVPGILVELAQSRPVSIPLPVLGGTPRPLSFDPHHTLAACPTLRIPAFIGIVSNHLGVKGLPNTDGYVIEGHTAGGHNAPPRSKEVGEGGEPVYGDKDRADFDLLKMLLAQNAARRGGGVQPFWLAGGYAGRLGEALAGGARGVQVGTPFAFCRESGVDAMLKRRILNSIMEGGHTVTSATASPSGFPFKVFQLSASVSEPTVYAQRRRACNLGYLFDVYDADGNTRCPAENVTNYVAKGGTAGDAAGRMCLCNGLISTIGLGAPGEPPLATAGSDHSSVKALVAKHGFDYTAGHVMEYISAGASISKRGATSPVG
jgi:NAD(P)H-dependent flavin oxidoreductase YrpB (nitropropane dioxygenase family)